VSGERSRQSGVRSEEESGAKREEQSLGVKREENQKRGATNQVLGMMSRCQEEKQYRMSEERGSQ
jgi:hypothetical protein